MKQNLFLVLGILATGFFLIQPSRISTGQQEPERQEPSLQQLLGEAKQLNKIDEKKKEELAAAVKEQSTPKPKVVYKVQRVPVVKEVLASDQKILLRVNGTDFYAPSETTVYKGYVVIDVDLDSLASDMREEESFTPPCYLASRYCKGCDSGNSGREYKLLVES